MIAALPMYDRAELRPVNDRLWQGVRAALGTGPGALTRDRDPANIWIDPDLLLAQTCGLPFRARLKDRVTLVGAPVHRLPDTSPGQYHSVIVARAGERRALPDLLASGIAAINDPLSQSGWDALRALAERLGATPTRAVWTGAHVASAAAVAEGAADIAALDAVTWDQIARFDTPLARRLVILHRTPPTPALPFITAKADLAAPLFRALAAAIAALDRMDRDALNLHGIVAAQVSTYTALSVVPPPSYLTRG